MNQFTLKYSISYILDRSVHLNIQPFKFICTDSDQKLIDKVVSEYDYIVHEKARKGFALDFCCKWRYKYIKLSII